MLFPLEFPLIPIPELLDELVSAAGSSAKKFITNDYYNKCAVNFLTGI